MPKKVIALLFVACLFCSTASADPGDAALQFKMGPSFNIQDLENQFKTGLEFDYELAYGFTINLATLVGFGGSLFVFEMIPMLKYNVLYIYPAVVYLGYGLGFATIDSEAGLAMRFSSGINLPLSKRWDAVTDLNFFLVPAGTTGTPASFDWLIGLRLKFP